jgi:hypothetical protein
VYYVCICNRDQQCARFALHSRCETHVGPVSLCNTNELVHTLALHARVITCEQYELAELDLAAVLASCLPLATTTSHLYLFCVCPSFCFALFLLLGGWVRFQGSEQDLLSAMSPCVQYPNISVVFARTNFSSSADPRDAATLVSVKGGGTYWSHNHLDLGSFSYESRAVRWAFDLGLEKCVCYATLRHTPMSKFLPSNFIFASPFFCFVLFTFSCCSRRPQEWEGRKGSLIGLLLDQGTGTFSEELFTQSPRLRRHLAQQLRRWWRRQPEELPHHDAGAQHADVQRAEPARRSAVVHGPFEAIRGRMQARYWYHCELQHNVIVIVAKWWQQRCRCVLVYHARPRHGQR